MKRAITLIAALVGLAIGTSSAQAAWYGPGSCHTSNKSLSMGFDFDNNKISTKKMPCWMAVSTVQSMLDHGAWQDYSFTYHDYGARWDLRLKCRNRQAPNHGTPQTGRIITCTGHGIDGMTPGKSVTKFSGATLRWATEYTG